MHGAGDGNIIFGDGLENYTDKDILPESFDILVANPPYSVKAFKPHLKLKNNKFETIDKISNDGSEIETLFVERISQLLKPAGVAAVILPASILNKENESFISAREIIFKNFMIRAIVMLGSKTFGETGTNTVILFLEKFKEPPKRIDIVRDSVDSIFEANELTDWEDEVIFNDYLRKINVDVSIYNDFVKCVKNYQEWQNDKYFKMYYEAFVSSAEYGNKSKQKNFLKLSEEERLAWYNERFYAYTHSKEKEKIKYFALIYQQTTLVINAPDDNKAQEKFLGYKWSKRKGQEGIQIIAPGGMLYSEDNRNSMDKISGLIRNTFLDKKYSVTELNEYAYYLKLKDMIDFESLSFTKAIKTMKSRVLKNTPGLISYKLSDTQRFDISIGNRVISDEVEEYGKIPIYSANVFEEFGRTNKQNITDFSMPSIIWGIDGDWMVNLLPAGMPFYPTDHCGVLRIKTDEIIPKYMALALEYEGKLQKFSRNNRASSQRIRNVTLQIPKDIKKQQRVVDKVTKYEMQILEMRGKIAEINDDLMKEFKNMFGILKPGKGMKNSVRLDSLCDNLDFKRKPITEHLREKGHVPYYGASGIVDYVKDYIFDETLLLVSEDGANLATRKAPIAFTITGKSWVNNHAHILRFSSSTVQKYVETYINIADLEEYINKNANPKFTQQSLNSLAVAVQSEKDLVAFEKIYDDALSNKEKISEQVKQMEAELSKYIVSVFG